MSKTYKGYELIKEIAEGNIKDGTRFKDSSGNVYIKTNDVGYLEDEKGHTILDCFYSLDELALCTFTLIEDNNEIDIDSIEELPEWVTRRNGEVTQSEGKRLEMAYKINELIQAIKQHDREIKELKER